ncbi:uncharacterized protein Tco025E_08810 [Trypanosoma conorhini]|uniref:Uncharacterized protein n=1 Tax=Trypanosoma conorhini TaxID=83891 RepID=A0A3R7K1X2_9TRYP|nr:uncharacterized protein Tco025E_08810 [Trypanosoma conorhini]RNF00365.1 hypothetical protein Tco025E_08810 [Trypanosoma conorhini]
MQASSDSAGPQMPSSSSFSGCASVAGEAAALEQLRHAHSAMQQYVAAEMDAYAEDWKLLGKCNAALGERCQEVWASTKDAVRELETTAEAIERLLPPLSEIDTIEAQLATLTEAVSRIDEYSKNLADHFGCT